MTTTAPHINPRGALRLAGIGVALVAAAFAATLAPAGQGAQSPRPQSATYAWPVKPFHSQHPVRGFFGDPRISRNADGSQVRQFHFGIDVSAPNGTPVYATLTGTVTIHPRHADVVMISAGGRVFEYWHVIASVRSGTQAVAYRTVIGHIEKPWAHVHFSERVGDTYLNPLRPGALGPYAKTTRPTVVAVRVVPAGAGRVDVVAQVTDDTPLLVRPPWSNLPVMPAVVQWRLRGAHVTATSWHTAFDARQTMPSNSTFDWVYAQGTRQNHARIQGLYRVYLAHGLETGELPAGRYAVEVIAADGLGNSTRGVASFTVGGPAV